MTVNQDAEQGRAGLREDPGLIQETLRQSNLIYGGLIVIGVYMVQPFLTAAWLDLSARICVVAFSVAIPLLAALVVVNRQELFRRRRTRVGILAAGLVAVGVHSAGWWGLERDQPPTPEDAGEPGDAEG
jgi:hypothetical protein